jgi:hypothetical protein
MDLPHSSLVQRKERPKPDVEIHGSCRDYNQVIRNLPTSRSKLLNTLGRRYSESHSKEKVLLVPEVTSTLLLRTYMAE